MGMIPARIIEVHIDELVLHGVDRFPGQRIAQTVRSELAQLFAARGLSPELESDVKVERMEGDVIRGVLGARDFGDQIAKSVFGALDRWGG
jgi:hypothetical protein